MSCERMAKCIKCHIRYLWWEWIILGHFKQKSSAIISSGKSLENKRLGKQYINLPLSSQMCWFISNAFMGTKLWYASERLLMGLDCSSGRIILFPHKNFLSQSAHAEEWKGITPATSFSSGRLFRLNCAFIGSLTIISDLKRPIREWFLYQLFRWRWNYCDIYMSSQLIMSISLACKQLCNQRDHLCSHQDVTGNVSLSLSRTYLWSVWTSTL